MVSATTEARELNDIGYAIKTASQTVEFIVDDQDEHLTPHHEHRLCDDGWLVLLACYKKPMIMAASLLVITFFLSYSIDENRPMASKGAAVMLVTALWWCTEIVPLTISSLLPMVLYPLFGVAKAGALAATFFKGTSFLFIAGFFIGLAVERWNLHQRIVCVVVTRAGRNVELLLAGFMFAVWFLSMWISNTATMLCMVPVADAFLESLPDGCSRFKSGFLLALGYSATIGGIVTPVGTPTNGIFLEYFAAFWPQEGEFSFATFFMCSLPLSISLLVTVWLGTCIMYVWRAPERIPVDKTIFDEMSAKLGKISFEQMLVAATLLVLIVLWFTASPIMDFPGWKVFIAPELNSGAIGLGLTLPLFLVPCGAQLPAQVKKFLGEDRCLSQAVDQNPQYILDWDALRGKFQWEILFVFGGGSLIAHGTVASGFANFIADWLAQVGGGEFGFILMMTFAICFITEIVSNMATLSIFGAIVATTAVAKGYDPVQFLLIVCLASSFAFMLPMAGGPNMVVYSTGKVSVRFMVIHGFVLNCIAVMIGSLYCAHVMPALLGDYTHLGEPASA